MSGWWRVAAAMIGCACPSTALAGQRAGDHWLELNGERLTTRAIAPVSIATYAGQARLPNRPLRLPRGKLATLCRADLPRQATV